MRKRITFETPADRGAGAMLLHVAILLTQLRPELVVFTCCEPVAGSDARIWLLEVKHKDESRLLELTEMIRVTDGVTLLAAEATGV